MAQIAVVTASLAGANLPVAYQAASAGGDKFQNTGKTMLGVKNGGGSPINVTIAAVNADPDGVIQTRVVAVAAGEEKWIGKFPPKYFNDGDGNVAVAFSGVTSVGVIAVEAP